MSYTVLARRYRSETFDDVVGQEAVGKTLKNAIATGRVAHAYLFTGTRGVGKTTMARILAKALNCQSVDEPTTTPCCKCESCQAISEGEDIDVLEIDGASNTGVEHIRELRQNAIYRPARGRFKIYIIDEVHMLSTSAFNALLKTLEEPPDHVKFIFATTEPNKILPTILSRCQRFDFRNIKIDDIVGHLNKVLADEGVEAEEALVRRIARLARGSMRDGLSLLDQMMSMSPDKLTLDMLIELLGTARSEQIMALVEAIGQNDLKDALTQVDAALGEGLALEQLAGAMQEHFRDLMVLHNCGPDTELVDLPDKDIRDKMVAQAKLFDDATLVYFITVMEELRRSIKSSGSDRALLEAAVVRLTASDRFSDTRVLLEQLQQLQSGGGGATGGSGDYSRNVSVPSKRTQLVKETPRVADSSSAPSPAVDKDDEVFVGPSEISLEYLRDNWAGILQALEKQGAKGQVAYLRPSVPQAWDDGTLTIGYQEKDKGLFGALKAQPGGIGGVEKALTGLFGTALKIILTQHDSDGEEPAKSAKSKSSKSTKAPPGAKPSQKEINTAVNDPRVKSTLAILGGKVQHIERLPEKK